MKKILVFLTALSLLSLLACPVAAAEMGDTAPTQNLAAKILISLLIGIAVALVIVLLMKRSMSTVRKQRNAGDYVKKNSFRLVESRDIYLYSTVTRVRVNTDKKRR